MSTERPSAAIRVQILVEVSLSASWGGDCTVSQVYDQGVQQATTAVAKALTDGRMKLIRATACDLVISTGEKR